MYKSLLIISPIYLMKSNILNAEAALIIIAWALRLLIIIDWWVVLFWLILVGAMVISGTLARLLIDQPLHNIACR